MKISNSCKDERRLWVKGEIKERYGQNWADNSTQWAIFLYWHSNMILLDMACLMLRLGLKLSLNLWYPKDTQIFSASAHLGYGLGLVLFLLWCVWIRVLVGFCLWAGGTFGWGAAILAPVSITVFIRSTVTHKKRQRYLHFCPGHDNNQSVSV